MYYAHRRIDLGQRAVGASLAVLGGVGLVWLATNLSVSGGVVTTTPFILVEPPQAPPPKDDAVEALKTDIDVPLPPINVVEVPPIAIDPVATAPTGPTVTADSNGDASPGRPDGGVGGAALPPPKTIAPVMRKFDLPPYPERSRMLREEGLTTLSYCVGLDGRPRNIQLAETSGHRRLDEAAMKWLGQQRFTPGTVDGVPAEMCRTYVYEWTLKR